MKTAHRRLWAALALFLVFLAPLAAETWSSIADEIGAYLDDSVRFYREGKNEEAKQCRYDAYFRIYELKEMEQAVQSWFGSKYNFNIEALFAEVTVLINEGRPVGELEALVEELMEILRESAAELDVEKPRENMSHGAIFAKALVILLREGLEAILILGAMIAILIKRKREDQVKTVYIASAAAVFASVLLAVFLNALRARVGITRGYAAQELFEGFVILAAVAVLLWVGGWLIKTSASEMASLKSRVGDASDKSSTKALALVSFLAVFREGAETVLFYQAMFNDVSSDRYGLVALGMAAAVVLLAVGFVLVRYGSVKLPLKWFFNVTGVFIFYMAFSMSGKAFLEFREAGWFEDSMVNFPTIPWLGIYPVLPGLLLQGAVVVASIAVYMVNKRKNVKTPSGNDG
ncbi:hypothetical protein CSB45_15650 [candidate division KSB3 bacterium]|uniref:Iron permease n=1 Tax=candidate division KSB3 bacterium TaxID=2044937 RepID=A0A2G6E0F0_9BACT|nr:MAG: hypothetical protein CSB45_15650 [candidate division KSB3 bacterium]